jgi:cytochrome P450
MTQPPPGSLGAPYVGEALKFLADPFEFTLARTRQHGNVWKTRILGDTVVFFAGPEAFSFFMNPEHFTRQSGSPKFLQALLHPDAVPFLDGDRHKTRKRLLLSAFTDEALASYLPGIFRILARFVAQWTGAARPVAADLSQCGFDIADYLFAASDPTQSNTQGAADFALMNKGTFAPPVNLPFTAYGKAIKARDRLRRYIGKQVRTRAGEGTALGILKAARGPNGEALTPEELEIELLHFYFAAHGGLTAALAWALVVLGENRELAGVLRAEADNVIGTREIPPTFAQLATLYTARAATCEILRRYPIAPVTFLGVAKKDLELDGFHIRRGWKGAGAIWATLQDPSTFQEPAKFHEGRLADHLLPQLPANAFVPQGGGPADGHRCPGDRLIDTILPAFLAWFTHCYDLEYAPQDATPGGGGLGPLPKSGVQLAVKARPMQCPR